MAIDLKILTRNFIIELLKTNDFEIEQLIQQVRNKIKQQLIKTIPGTNKRSFKFISQQSIENFVKTELTALKREGIVEIVGGKYCLVKE
ncbi:MAG: hypothetical protein J7L80_01665 [Thermoplasmata archaeon]|nr:hypothetical protein [Thermoplasmata archaeon]